MKKRLSLRVKLSLVVVLLVAGLSVFTASSVFRIMRIDMAHVERIRMLADLRLTLLFLDMVSGDGWRSSSSTLYKGTVPLSSGSPVLEEIKPYLSPGIVVTFGVGEPPSYRVVDRFGSGPFWFIGYLLDWTIRSLNLKDPYPMLKEIVFPSDDTLVMRLSDHEGTPVGWVNLKYDGELKYAVQNEFLYLFVATSGMVIAIILGILYVIIFRISAPIDKLILRNRHMVIRNRELDLLSRTDQLTGLLNRRGLDEILKNEVEGLVSSGETVSLALLDIDDFKAINDNYGHDCGDAVLRELGKLINDSVRSQDTAIRWGGEEFLILFPDLEEAGMKDAAERIRCSVANYEFECGGTRIPVTVTAGVARCSPDCTFEEALKQADEALYLGKRSGKNRTCGCADVAISHSPDS